jgi:hypothetical protein
MVNTKHLYELLYFKVSPLARSNRKLVISLLVAIICGVSFRVKFGIATCHLPPTNTAQQYATLLSPTFCDSRNLLLIMVEPSSLPADLKSTELE